MRNNLVDFGLLPVFREEDSLHQPLSEFVIMESHLVGVDVEVDEGLGLPSNLSSSFSPRGCLGCLPLVSACSWGRKVGLLFGSC